MSNTRTLMNPDAGRDGDPHGDLDHIPRGGVVPERKDKKSPYKTGKAGSWQAAAIDTDERIAATERASLAGLERLSADERQAASDRVHAIRVEKLGLQNGQDAVAESVHVEPIEQGPEYPPVEPGAQAKIFE